MSTGYFGDRETLYLDNLFWGLITSSHILHKHGIFDAYGHVSVRNPDNPSNFFIPMNMAPALLSSADEIIECKVEDGEPAEKTDKPQFSEKYIHSEIYKKFPSVNAVVHSHCSDVLPYCITDVPLKAPIHTTGFLGPEEVPVWDIASVYSSSDKRHDLLVRNTTHGHALAAAFKPSTSGAFIYSKMRSALPTQLGGSTATEPVNVPNHPVVLMRGHGFTTCADGLEAVVYQAIYTREAAKVTTTALSNSQAWSQKALVGQIDVQGAGKIKDAKLKDEGKGLHLLSAREVDDTLHFIRDTKMRPWGLWLREVEVDPMYQNNAKREDSKL
ncbi:hypothetical protein BT63DRAFT_427978 [Microthyrium microscopicum]|uniref:Class II aldolase/adducin N-terminal domain-containing protein n=1 Tax=Microthyrium microscopicum TaxID=703497 RepID=A0A6A6U1N1_9PEZI|nr:hypothetical protein BT63DRAFT_427978 [Microthyrium microscopicum]